MKISIVLKSYVRSSLVNRNKKKDARTDEILIEMLSVLDNFGFVKITEIIIEIYESSEELGGYTLENIFETRDRYFANRFILKSRRIFRNILH